MAHLLERRREAHPHPGADHPGRAEDPFRELGALGDDFDPATLPAMAERYGAKVDVEGTAAVIERHGLRF